MSNCKIQSNNSEKCNKECNCNNNRNEIASALYLIFHVTLSLIAFYLSWKCNNQTFDLYSFISALLFPYFYIIYILSTRGTCGIIFNEQNIK